ncbi:MAG: hypothetical protein DA328_00630 [Nitrososphaeraceae archaeon]|nr:hypothetical protein [Nitrososphaeraceae archaeon]
MFSVYDEKIFSGYKFFIMILILLLNSVNLRTCGAGNFHKTTFVNSTNLDISNLIYDINSNPFNISYVDWTKKWWQ